MLKIWTIDTSQEFPEKICNIENWHCLHDLAWRDRIEVNWYFTSLHLRYIIQRTKKTKGEQMITLFVPSQGISCPKNHEFCKLVMLFVYYDVLTRACANNLLT